MKEVKLKLDSLWSCITALIIAAMLCGTFIYTSTQYNQAQKDIASTQTEAQKKSATQLNDGLKDIAKGLCQTTTRQYVTCNNY